MEQDRERAHRAWRQAERIKRLSDGLLRIGPLRLGVDGVIAWAPGAGTVYSAVAAGLLIYEAMQAGAKPATLARMAAYLLADTASSSVPFVGWAIDTLFPGHLLAAKALQKDIEKRHGKSELPEDWGRASWFGRRRRRDEGVPVVDLPEGGWRAK